MLRALAVGLLLLATPAVAEPTVLRFSLVAPDGTAWAKEFKAFAWDVERGTRGEVTIKLYFSGVAGDDFESLGRLQRGQLEGVASASMLCEHLAPSMRALRLLGVFNSREESDYVRGKLNGLFDEEFQHAGFVNLGFSSLGAARMFSRVPVRTFADVKRVRTWVWDIDRLGRLYAEALGMTAVPMPITQVRAALDEGRLDAVMAVPTAALAYQWFTRLKYYTDVRTAFLTGCLVMESRTLERLPAPSQEVVRAAAKRLAGRLDVLGKEMDETLLVMFRKQGMQEVAVPESVRLELFEAYRGIRERLGEQLVPSALVKRVIALLTVYRAGSRP